MAEKTAKIRWTIVDEAPRLATFSLLPIIQSFIKGSGVEIETRDISLAGRIVANFPEKLTEAQKQSDDLAFLGELANQWEQEALLCEKPTTILRFGVVLGKGGGALAQMLTPFRLGLGGTIGNGSMMTSWIHIEDLLRTYHFVIENKLTGIFNAVSPTPVTNYTLTKALGKAW